MPDEFSDEELVLTDSECASPAWPSLPVIKPVSKPAKMRKGHSTADNRKLISITNSVPVASQRWAGFEKFAYAGASQGQSTQAASKPPEVIDLSPDSEKKTSRPHKKVSRPQLQKKQLNNAVLFEDSEDESELSEPLSKRLKVAQTHSEAAQSCSPEVETQMERQPHRVFAKAKSAEADDKQDLLQQLEVDGEELQNEDSDAVLQRCEQLSAQLRQALQMQGIKRDAAADISSDALISHAALVKACGEAAKYFKPYQMVGVNFLLLLKRQGITGCILADEMGLGKTAQAICFLGVLRAVDQDAGPHLVVVPPSLLENWQRELKRWCPALKVVTYYGKDRASLRHQLLNARRSGTSSAADSDVEIVPDSSEDDSDVQYLSATSDLASSEQAAPPTAASSDHDNPQMPFNVMLTCYTLFERDSVDQQADRSFLRKWPWSHLLLDEAHALKNASAMRTRRLTKLAEHCQRRIMLTGTPLQNDLGELQNLLQFILPDVFDQQDIDLSSHLQHDEDAVQQLTERMKAMLGPFVLRRLKTEVASQLTAKQQRVEMVGMTDSQAELYQSAVLDLRTQVGTAAKGKSGKAKAGSSLLKQLGKQRVANMFVHLRKIAQHPLLVRHHFSDTQVQRIAVKAHERQLFGGSPSQGQVCEELLGYSDYRLHDFAVQHGLTKWRLPDDAVLASGKCRLLVELLADLQEKGSRPLIFSQWTSVLDILGLLFEHLRLAYVRLDGSTAVSERLATVDLFNNASKGIFAFLLSTRAGGQGLNLTGADTVILHDVDFNPQIDRQAEDRCHRLGQTKLVTVYRLVTEGTVDEGIFGLAKQKLLLDAAVLQGITAGKQAHDSGQDAAQMGQLLQALVTGDNTTGSHL